MGHQFDTIDRDTAIRHIAILVVVTIVVKFIVLGLIQAISFVDYFDLGVYLKAIDPVMQGQIPYISYPFEYPILTMVPILLAFIPAFQTQNGMAFIYSFQTLMILCDILIVLSVYLIGLKIHTEMTAFYGGLIYATAFSAAYFVVTKSDAFPTALLMLGILFTIYGMKARGYALTSAGFFAKIFPVIALPFMVLYNSKMTTLKAEILAAGKIFLLFCVILLIPLAIVSPSTLGTYLFATGGSVGVYPNTATYTIYAWLSEVLHLGISSGAVSIVMYALMAAGLLLLVYLSFIGREQSDRTFLKLVLCAIFFLFVFTKFHSPQYLVWFTPLLAILVADDLVKVGLFYAAQVFAYIEFPLIFGSFYTNAQYMNPAGSLGWYMTLVFFTLEYVVFIALVYFTVRSPQGLIARLKVCCPVARRKES